MLFMSIVGARYHLDSIRTLQVWPTIARGSVYRMTSGSLQSSNSLWSVRLPSLSRTSRLAATNTTHQCRRSSLAMHRCLGSKDCRTRTTVSTKSFWKDTLKRDRFCVRSIFLRSKAESSSIRLTSQSKCSMTWPRTRKISVMARV